MIFFLDINPPTTTHQQKQVAVINGKPRFYEPDRLKAARQLLTLALKKHTPKKPFQGALYLKVVWLFPKGTRHKDGEWKTTKPDTDNLQKLLKDCMTDCGFWGDDKQVAQETVAKKWAEKPGIEIMVMHL